MPADARIALELQRLEGLIAQTGLADRRPELRALLAAAGRQAPMPRVRGGTPAAPSRAKQGAKLVALLRGGLDLAMLAALGWLLLCLWRDDEDWAEAAAVLAPLGTAWALARIEPLRDGLYEAAFRLFDDIWFAWDWLAEAFNVPAMHRFARRQAARDVMAAWQQHLRGLPPEPGLPAVEAFLARDFGAPAARAFRAAVTARMAPAGGAVFALRGGSPSADRHRLRRMQRLRWSALIRLFETVAGSGVFWGGDVWVTPLDPQPLQKAAPVATEAPRPVADPAAEALRKQGLVLREALRRKRADLSQCYTWKIKTPAEAAQRDAHADGLRAEIAALERELEALKA